MSLIVLHYLQRALSTILHRLFTQLKFYLIVEKQAFGWYILYMDPHLWIKNCILESLIYCEGKYDIYQHTYILEQNDFNDFNALFL